MKTLLTIFATFLVLLLVSQQVQASNTTNTTTSGNTTMMSGNTTTTMENTTTSTMDPATTTTTMDMTTSTTMVMGNVTTAWIMGSLGGGQSFDPMTFINDLATALGVSNTTLNMTRYDGNSVWVTITAVDADTIAANAVSLSIPTLNNMGLSLFSIVTTSTAAPPTNSTTTTTMEATNATTTTTTTTTTMAPTDAPVPTYPCNTLMYHENCSMNNTCSEFNLTCVVDCGTAASTAVCGMWPHCMVAADQRTCIFKCSNIMSHDACAGAEDCSWFNGKCDNFCSAHKSSATCATDSKCWWDSTVCRANCALATDAIQCSFLLATPGEQSCAWDESTKMCVRSCYSFNANTCSAQPGCYWASSLSWCLPDCRNHMDGMSCGANAMCTWYNNSCSLRCAFRSNQADCTMNSACSYIAAGATNPAICYVTNCSAITNAASCEKETSTCQWDASSNQCKTSCLYAKSSSDCPAAPYCNYTTTCMILDCWYATSEASCLAKTDCAWSNSMCKMKCEQISNVTECAASSHCSVSKSGCAPVCSSYTSWGSCVGAGEDCLWSTSTSKCYKKCSNHRTNPQACSAPNSGCTYRSSNTARTCTATCSLATTAEDCMSPFFQDSYGCWWDTKAAMCKTACEISSIGGQCTAPCAMDANFSWCALPPPASTTTMAPTTSTSMAPSTSTSTVASSTTTNAQQTSTTMMNGESTSTMSPGDSAATTSTMAPPTTTTAAPGNPRIQFSFSSEANATGNITTSSIATKLAAALGISPNSLSVTITESGVAVVEFTSGSDAASQAAAAANATNAIGAYAAASLAPATTAAPTDDDAPPLGLIVGASVGGAVLIIIILAAIKMSSSGGSGSKYNDGTVGDEPMLQVPQQQGGQRHNML